MKMLMTVSTPHEKFNAEVKEGTAGPCFLNFDAECEFDLMMTPQGLQESGLDDIGKKWS